MSQVNHNYSYITEVEGYTVWEKLRIIRNFLVDRQQALAVSEMGIDNKMKKVAEGLLDKWEIRRLEIFRPQQLELIQDCKDEVDFLVALEAKLAEVAELERVPGKSDREMYEINFVKEAQTRLLIKVHSEILSTTRISPDTMISLMKDRIVLNKVIELGLANPELIKLIDKTKPKAISCLEELKEDTIYE